MNEEKNIIMVQDSIGRLILVELISNDGGVLTIKNPLVATPTQMQDKNVLQFLPYCFVELIDREAKDAIWEFPLNTFAIYSGSINPSIAEAYEKLAFQFYEAELQQPNQPLPNDNGGESSEEEVEPGKIVKLFDD